jgi:ribosomal protein S3
LNFEFFPFIEIQKFLTSSILNQISVFFYLQKRKTTTVSIEVRKSQHKYVIGPKGGTIQEILSLTGVAVEIPPAESDSETITLRGDPDKLGVALTHVYEKANSVVFAEVEAPRWLHRFIIGRKGQNIRKITQDLPKVSLQ